jgi:hypothetical protein
LPDGSGLELMQEVTGRMPCSPLDQHEPTRPVHPPPGDLLTADHEPEQRQALGRLPDRERDPDRHVWLSGDSSTPMAPGTSPWRIAAPLKLE